MFYSMDIETDNPKEGFYFVYDCGSNSVKKYFDEQIEEYRDNHEKICLLVVSHFDKDHVNGISKLIKARKVEKLILPYVDWKERLAISLITEKPLMNSWKCLATRLIFSQAGSSTSMRSFF